jgi:hypothetical protein
MIIEMLFYLAVWAFWYFVLIFLGTPELAQIIISLIFTLVTGPILHFYFDEFIDWFFGEFLD